MALVKCPDCGTEVSTQATACPKCGRAGNYSAPKAKPKTSIFIAGFLVFVAVVMLLMSKYTNHRETAAEQARIAKLTPEERAAEATRASAAATADAERKTTEDRKLQNAFLGAQTLKGAMRNPESFKLASALVMPSGAICYQYRAQNGFGGLNVESAVLEPSSILKTEHSSGFVHDWNKYCAKQTGQDLADTINYLLK